MQLDRFSAGVGLTGVLAGALAAGCMALLEAASTTIRALWGRRDGPAFDDLVLAGALGVLALAAGWLCVGVVVCAVAEAVPGADALARRAARRLTPAFCRRLVAVLCGAAAVAGPVGVLPASGVAPDQLDRRPGARTAPVCGSPLSGLPVPDRPVSGVLLARPRAQDPPAHRPAHDLPVVSVRVRRGDTLWSVAKHRLPHRASDADVAVAWRRWYRANRARVGPDPHLIHPGTRLRPPPRPR